MGPYCKYCHNRCFVPFPQETPQYILDAYGGVALIATCCAGQDFEKERFGYCYDDICAAIRTKARLERYGRPLAYNKYLNAWAERFGDDLVGEYVVFLDGKQYFHELTRLTKPQFEQHTFAFQQAQEILAKAETDEEVEMALALSFPHEIALLL